MDVNLNFLECFAILSDTLSFTETAKALRVSQPCISRQIRLLEGSLNTRLFVRDKQRVYLSEQGKLLKARINPLLREIKLTLESLETKSHRLEGVISFGSLAEIGQSTLMRHLLSFQNEHAGVFLNIGYLQEEEIVRRVKTGELDFGVVPYPPAQESLKASPLLTERIVLVTRTQNKKDPDSAKAVDFVVYEKDDPLLHRFLRVFDKHLPFRQVRRSVVVNSHRSMIDALLARDCYAVMPYFSIQHLIDQKKIRIVSNREFKNELFLIYLESHLVERKNVAFREFLLKRCAIE